ncbi:MAG: hypothetical protein CMG24_06095 [Candidatus Marinimicrobia bacterium]|jgi:hypothetical protein|nr:hypothetical protein [Candidatus Neomarinimicrobiota bacterium]|tara:strand:- start:367 stop:561 length:195 start_codon:yes stop_codon:yes gene_type:complete
MKIEFKAFTSILVGMTLIGLGIGFLVGFYIPNILSNIYWVYLSAPILGLGSGFVMYGALFEDRK